MSLFKLRGTLPSSTRIILEISGILLLLSVWHLITMGAEPMMNPAIFPSPGTVLGAFGSLYSESDLVTNTFRSMGLNLAGYVEAISISLLIGFTVGLFPLFRGLFNRPIDAFRYVPLTAMTGLFITWFGLGIPMKTHFLAFGILIYLLPIVVQRIDEVNDVYLKTVYTLGATDWQTIRSVYIPSVMSRLWDDIRVLTAISWTYIIIAEALGNQGGLGSLIYRLGQRQGKVDVIFALLLIIIAIGFLQDRIFTYLDREFFPYKYQSGKNKERAAKEGIGESIWNFASGIIGWSLCALYVLLFINEFVGFYPVKVLDNFFGETVWVIHLLGWSVIVYKLNSLYQKHTNKLITSPAVADNGEPVVNNAPKIKT
ncbi:MAG: NitT/TauT family transport system permease protein, partial [Patescibacteria group bacterium]